MKVNLQRKDRMQVQADALTAAEQFHSVAWHVSHHGETVSHGSSIADPSRVVTGESIYRIYSMTKPVVSLVALQLIEEGLLHLSDEVGSYIPAMADMRVSIGNGKYKRLQSPITLAQLLTHTAGFSYDFLPQCDVAESYREVHLTDDASRTLAEYIELLAELPLASQPGQVWRYSVATDVLARVLEVVTNQELPELLQERVFTPLGMHDTAFYVPQSKKLRLQPMFGVRHLGELAQEQCKTNTLQLLDVDAAAPFAESKGFYRGGHGLFSTILDYAKFAAVLQSGISESGEPLLSAPMLEMLWSNRIPWTMQPLSIGPTVLGGYGWGLLGRVMLDVGQADGLSALGEGGWAGAASTYFWVDRSNAMTGVVMSQYLGSNIPLGMRMQTAAYQMFVNE